MTDILTWFHNANAIDLCMLFLILCFCSFLSGFVGRAWEIRRDWRHIEPATLKPWHNRSHGELINVGWLTPTTMNRSYFEWHLVVSLFMKAAMVIIEEINRQKAWQDRPWSNLEPHCFPGQWWQDIETIVASRFPREERKENDTV